MINHLGKGKKGLETKERNYFIEFKCAQNASLGNEQIKNKGYMDKFKMNKKENILLAINFNIQSRNINDWLVERVN